MLVCERRGGRLPERWYSHVMLLVMVRNFLKTQKLSFTFGSAGAFHQGILEQDGTWTGTDRMRGTLNSALT